MEFDPVGDFSEWLGKKVGGKNKHRRNLTMIITSFALLEFGQNVLNIGSGFTKMDLSGITLKQIKETVQRIEEKVDRLLETPLKNAKEHFDFAITRVTHGVNKEACAYFDKVIAEGTAAFNNIENKKITIPGFQACIESARLVIFSQIAKDSYDEKKECFLPFILLKKRNRGCIVEDLEKHVTKCVALKENIRTSSFFFTSATEIKDQIQDMLDIIIKICYPYLSEIRKWTTMGTKVPDQTQDRSSFTIKVFPKHLPFGSQDKAKLAIGIDPANNEHVFLEIWRTKDYVLTICQGVHSCQKIWSPSELMQYDVFNNNRKTIVFTSTSTAAQRSGSILGQYSFDPEEGCYMQTTTEPKSHAIRHYFLFLHDKKEWFVSETKVKNAFSVEWLRSSSPSEEPPMDKWEFRTHLPPINKWSPDPSLKITRGPMTSLCCTLKVDLFHAAAEKYPDLQGEFTRTNRWLYGRPVFQNSHGRLLFQHNDHSATGNDGWAIGWEIGKAYLRGLMARHCPSQENSWSYWNGIKMVKATIIITCDIHPTEGQGFSIRDRRTFADTL